MSARTPDTIVIGAGIIGCATAYELARRGASVTVIDPRPAGMGATQAAAGMLAPFIEAEDGSALFDVSVRSLHLYDDFIARVCADSGQAVSYQRTGTLQVATDAARLAHLTQLAGKLAQRHIEHALLDAADVRAEEPALSNDAMGGLLIPAHGFVNVPQFATALAAAGARLGVQFVDGEVTRVEATGAGVGIETRTGRYEASRVIVAGGAWSAGLDITGVTERIPVRPVRGQLLQLGWQGTPLRRITWGSRCYLVPWEDGTLLVGATAEHVGFDERTTAGGVRDLLGAVCDLLPDARTATFKEARVGLRPGCGDELPAVGWSGSIPGLMYATGHYRHGILLAPITATLVAGAMLDDEPDPALELMSPRRFWV